MRYTVRTCEERPNAFFWYDEFGEKHWVSGEPIVLTSEQLGATGLRYKRIVCTPIAEADEVPAPEPEAATAEPTGPFRNPKFNAYRDAHTGRPASADETKDERRRRIYAGVPLPGEEQPEPTEDEGSDSGTTGGAVSDLVPQNVARPRSRAKRGRR